MSTTSDRTTSGPAGSAGADPAEAPVPPPLPPVMRACWVARPADEAFRVFTDEIGAWWPLPTHGIFGEAAGGVAFRDGRLVEYSIDGSTSVWAEVLAWEPPDRLVLSWHPGREASDASEVEVRFVADGDGTRVEVDHHGWERFGEAGRARRRGYIGPNAWGYTLDHYADGAEATAEPADLGELGELAAAYDAFFAEFERGGFAEPTDGGWTAAQVVAHVALNDAAMLGVCQALVHQRPARFSNATAQDRAALDRWVDSCGGPDQLAARGRHAARLVRAALWRLSPDQRATAVHCHLADGGRVMVDGERPWEAIAVTVQAEAHLPSHTRQLQDLRR